MEPDTSISTKQVVVILSYLAEVQIRLFNMLTPESLSGELYRGPIGQLNASHDGTFR